MSTPPVQSTPPDGSTTTGVFAAASGYLSAVEVHGPATQQSASWSGGTSKPNAQRYRCIVADPPWPIDAIAQMPRVSEGGNGKGSRNGLQSQRPGKLDYNLMTMAQIAALPVRDLAEDGAHLYLWTINRHLEATYGIARAWGFKPVQVLTWAKKPRGICLGTFTSSTEFVLFCRRGTLKALRRVDTTWWNWPRSNTHSVKPESFTDMVESVSPGPRLELFARRQRLGWHSWGNQALCHVTL
jgi:N6-adenosine-specific RNA methylase IME4